MTSPRSDNGTLGEGHRASPHPPLGPRYCLRALECAGLRVAIHSERPDEYRRWYVWVGCLKELFHTGNTYLQPAKPGLRAWIVGDRGRACTGLERSWKRDDFSWGFALNRFLWVPKVGYRPFTPDAPFSSFFFYLIFAVSNRKKAFMSVQVPERSCVLSGQLI